MLCLNCKKKESRIVLNDDFVETNIFCSYKCLLETETILKKTYKQFRKRN